MSKLRLFVLTGLLAAAVAPLYGCGNECGPGMTEEDGQCIVVEQGCGEGTLLSNGQCIIDNTGCGEGTILEDGECVPDDSSCAEGTTFDQRLSVCVANTEIVCGEGTEDDGGGTCAPNADACGDKTSLNDDGRCVIATASCGEGTELAPNSGECVLAEDGCGKALALDAETDQCVPTEEVCDEGTEFDADSGLCLPDACQEGDVLVDGICMDPAEELAHNAELEESENNDPAFDGTANTLEPNGIDEDAFVFAGTIATPEDLDGDGVDDQDVDVFEFDATAGDWFELMVQSAGLPAPGFKIEGPEGYVRYSQTAGAREVARDFVIPRDGTYTISVLPAHALEEGEDFAPVGDDAWTYVASLDAVSAPAPTDADISEGSTQIEGELLQLNDNLFSLDGLSADETFTLTPSALGADAEAVVQIWADATTLHSTSTLRAGEALNFSAPSTGDALVLVDWIRADGPNLDFDIDATINGSQTIVTIDDGATEVLTVHAQALDRIVASHANSDGARLDLAIKTADGEILAARRIGEYDELPVVVFEEGDYTIELSNNSGATLDATVMANITSPQDLGEIPEGGSVTSSPTRLAEGGKAYYRFSASAGEVLSVTQENADDASVNLTFYDTTGEQAMYEGLVDAISGDNFIWSDHVWEHLDEDVTWIVEVEARAIANDYTMTLESIHPEVDATLNLDEEVSISSEESYPKGLSGFHLVEFNEEMNFYGSVTPDPGQDVDFFLYDPDGDEIIGTSGINGGTKSFGDVIDETGVYLAQVRCDDACTGYELTFGGYGSTIDLGEIDLGESATSEPIAVFSSSLEMTYDFSVPAGAVIELSHDSDGGSTQTGELYDADDEQLAREYSFYAVSGTSYSAPTYMYHYAQDAADFSLLLDGRSSATNQEVTVRAIEPSDLGQIGVGGSVDDTVFDTLTEHQRFFHSVTFSEAGAFGGAVLPAGDEDMDVHMYDEDFNEIDSWTSGSGDRGFGGEIEEAGTYLFATECEDDDCPGFEFTAHMSDADADLGELETGETTHTIGDLSYGQPYTLNFSVPSGHVVEVSHTNDEAQQHDFELVYEDSNWDLILNETSFYPTNADDEEVYGYTYTFQEGVTEMELVIEGRGMATNQEVTIDVSEPEAFGTLDATGTGLTHEFTETCAAGQSVFGAVELTEAMTFDATITPPGDETFNFYTYDAANEELYEESDAVTFEGLSARLGGVEQLVRIECRADTAGFDVTMDNVTSLEEELADLDADDSVTTTVTDEIEEGDEKVYTFTAPAGQIIEVVHDNDGGDPQTIWLYDADGNTIAGDTNVYARSGNYGAENLYGYSGDGGTFSLYFLGRRDAEDVELTVSTITPEDLDVIYADDPAVTLDHNSPLHDSKRHYYEVELNGTGELTVEAEADNGEDLELEIFDTDHNSLDRSTLPSSGIDDTIELEQGSYYVAIEADGDVDAFSGTLELTLDE